MVEVQKFLFTAEAEKDKSTIVITFKPKRGNFFASVEMSPADAMKLGRQLISLNESKES